MNLNLDNPDDQQIVLDLIKARQKKQHRALSPRRVAFGILAVPIWFGVVVALGVSGFSEIFSIGVGVVGLVVTLWAL